MDVNEMAKAKELIRGRWSKGELELLKKQFPHRRTQEIADRFGRPLTAVRQKAYELGLKTKHHHPCWSKEETDLLKKLFPHKSTKQVADRLGRPVGSVQQKALKMGIKKTSKLRKSMGLSLESNGWSRNEVGLLKQLFPVKKTRQIANQLGRPVAAVNSKAYKIGLRKNVYRSWSKDEVELLKKLFPNQQSQRQLAEQLGRSVTAVNSKAYKIGVRKSVQRSWSMHQKEVLRKRSYIKKKWCIQVLENPMSVERQEDNRFRFQGIVEEFENQVLQVVTLEDKNTIHNTFTDGNGDT